MKKIDPETIQEIEAVLNINEQSIMLAHCQGLISVLYKHYQSSLELNGLIRKAYDHGAVLSWRSKKEERWEEFVKQNNLNP